MMSASTRNAVSSFGDIRTCINMFLHHVKRALPQGRPALVGRDTSSTSARRDDDEGTHPHPLHPIHPPRSKVNHGPPPAGARCTSRSTEAGPRARAGRVGRARAHLLRGVFVVERKSWSGPSGRCGSRAGVVGIAREDALPVVPRGVIPGIDAVQMREGGPNRGAAPMFPGREIKWRGAVPATEPRAWKAECGLCRDTGWIEHLCTDRTRCGRSSRAARSPTRDHSQSGGRNRGSSMASTSASERSRVRPWRLSTSAGTKNSLCGFSTSTTSCSMASASGSSTSELGHRWLPPGC